MIIDAIFSIFISPLRLLLNLLPIIDIEIPSDIITILFESFKLLGFFLPLKTICVILGLKLSMWMFRITLAIIVRVKSFIPTMGA